MNPVPPRDSEAGSRRPGGDFVSVIIPHYNDLSGLAKCLSHLDRQTLPRDRFEIVIADNNSLLAEGELAAVIAGRARLVFAVEQGAGPARNAAVKASLGGVLAFIDADCWPAEDWLSAGLAALERYDIVGGQVETTIPSDRQMTGAEAFERVFAFDFKNYIEKKGFTGTGNMFCRRTTFDRVGPFGKGVSEDRDWSFRARALGLRIGYAPDAVVCHPARADWAALTAKWRRINRESYLLDTRKPLGRVRWAARSVALIPSIALHAPRIIRTPRLATAADRARALGTLARIRLWRFVEAQRLLWRDAR